MVLIAFDNTASAPKNLDNVNNVLATYSLPSNSYSQIIIIATFRAVWSETSNPGQSVTGKVVSAAQGTLKGESIQMQDSELGNGNSSGQITVMASFVQTVADTITFEKDTNADSATSITERSYIVYGIV